MLAEVDVDGCDQLSLCSTVALSAPQPAGQQPPQGQQRRRRPRAATPPVRSAARPAAVAPDQLAMLLRVQGESEAGRQGLQRAVGRLSRELAEAEAEAAVLRSRAGNVLTALAMCDAVLRRPDVNGETAQQLRKLRSTLCLAAPPQAGGPPAAPAPAPALPVAVPAAMFEPG
eukprot:TRINITY_DN7453_c0_g2_i1.p3 TRINITY_DN7453_c0_g2~~TRINITY_DN7453_c0_g2_i1.p3  ORF type:complete len:199 (+),score=50.21 TRINITY_DN7453_c0_g2_i1:84-599(+)